MTKIIEICERLNKALDAPALNVFAKVKHARLMRELQAEEDRMLWPLLAKELSDTLTVTTHNENTGTVRVTVEVNAEVAEALADAPDINDRLAACGFERMLLGDALDGLRYVHFITAA